MNSDWRIPILTYHGLHAPGWGYAENDHVALEHDLGALAARGYKVVPLEYVVKLLLGAQQPGATRKKLVAITFDDGTDLDFEDFSHPDYGYLKSFRRILTESPGLGMDGGIPQATSFVIASPYARTELDKACIAGRGQWNDTWWDDSAKAGPISIANHSWDHVHPAVSKLVVDSLCTSRFDLVADFESADAEILQAERFIQQKTGNKASPFFAYPYGHVNEFLPESYFPARTEWFEAAFTTAGRPVTASESRWRVPRFVCGEHWNSPEAFLHVLGE